MEMTDALTYRGLKVTVVECFDSVLTTVDPEFGYLVQAELEENGVAVYIGIAVKKLKKMDRALSSAAQKTSQYPLTWSWPPLVPCRKQNWQVRPGSKPE
jgi:pyruvate/2-oxoglutarate dehydrogenase complex dihydrolipoamide dehydrogenase (E3) component